MSCTTFKSVIVDFTEPAIKPANGYVVKYRIAGETNYITLTPNPMASPAIIPNIASCANVEGTISTSCDGNVGLSVSFVASTGTTVAQTPTCSYYVLTEPVGSSATSIYRYIPCGSTAAVTKSISGGHSITTGICAENSMGVTKIFGEGVITKEGSCTTDNPITTAF
jgi:hypothetical protein